MEVDLENLGDKDLLVFVRGRDRESIAKSLDLFLRVFKKLLTEIFEEATFGGSPQTNGTLDTWFAIGCA